EHGQRVEVLLIDREVLDQVLADAIEPLLLLDGEAAVGGERREREVYPFLGGQERLSLVRGMLDHRDHVDERLVIVRLMGILELPDGEVLWCRRQRLPEFGERP